MTATVAIRLVRKDLYICSNVDYWLGLSSAYNNYQSMLWENGQSIAADDERWHE